MKKTAAILALAFPLFSQAAPHDLKGNSYDMAGTIKVKAAARCGGFAGGGGATSPVNGQEIGATITFPDSDLPGGSFVWSNDALMPPMATASGEIKERKGNKLSLEFTGDGATAFLGMAGIADSGTILQNGAVVKSKYGITAVAAKDKIKVTEKLTYVIEFAPCKYKWTVSRVLKGPVSVPPT